MTYIMKYNKYDKARGLLYLLLVLKVLKPVKASGRQRENGKFQEVHFSWDETL